MFKDGKIIYTAFEPPWHKKISRKFKDVYWSYIGKYIWRYKNPEAWKFWNEHPARKVDYLPTINLDDIKIQPLKSKPGELYFMDYTFKPKDDNEGLPKMQFYKNYIMGGPEDPSPDIETIAGGPDLTESDTLEYFRNELKENKNE